MKTVLLITGSLMIAATLFPFLKTDRWYVRSFDFPRIQVMFLLAVTAIAYLPFVFDSGPGDKLFWLTLLACLAHQCYRMFPYTPLARKQVEQSRTPGEENSISLLFANVLMENRKARQLKDLIKKTNPDIILTAEVNKWWLDELKELEEIYPHTVYQPQNNHYGMALFSKYELIDPEVRFLIEDHIPSIHSRVRMSGGKHIALRCLHPEPPFINGEKESTQRDAELLVVGKELKKLKEPAIVFGDLNDVAWSRTNYVFQDISGLLDPRIGRGFYNTFHAKYPFLRFPLDHAFHTNHFRLTDFRRLSFFGSDHFPVYIKLSYEPDAELEQEELQPDETERDEANEKIDKAQGAQQLRNERNSATLTERQA